MRVGIIGNGQLARMLILAGAPMGIDYTVFAQTPSPCTQQLAEHIIGPTDSDQAVEQFISQVDVITYENENISVEFIQRLNAECPVFPSALALQKMQHRFHEKNTFKALDIPVHPYCGINTQSDLAKARDRLGYPFIVKSCRYGYDGKQQWLIDDTASFKAFQKLLPKTSDETAADTPTHIAEDFIHFDKEVSIIGARDSQNNIVFYDVCHNTHKQGILRRTQSMPNHSLWGLAKQYLIRLMEAIDYVGVGALELFVKEDQLLANEFAPRVHNSGHWTIEGATTSQFENHTRAVCGLPLGACDSLDQTVMYNCIGVMPSIEECLTIPSLYYHDYKKTPRPQRKLGHLTLKAKYIEQVEKILGN